MMWIPANHQMQSAGLSDDLAQAEAYLHSTVTDAHGAEAVDYLQAHTEIRLQPVKVYPDYYPDLPGATAARHLAQDRSPQGITQRERP